LNPTLASALSEGLQALGLPLTADQQQRLLDYLALLNKWNRVYNLTAVREPEQMLYQHLLDCLAAVVPLQNRYPAACDVLDVGAGGGLPSVVFAIACPNWRVTAVDTVAKKAAFIQTVAHQLGLGNLQAVHARVEALEGRFDLVTCRAFASLQDFCSSSRHLLGPDGRWLALKAKHPQEELDELPPSVLVEQIEPLAVPGLDAQRCLVWMKPTAKEGDLHG
jgi:16S rRNA (guanine527-N7)-methyltransferase